MEDKKMIEEMVEHIKRVIYNTEPDFNGYRVPRTVELAEELLKYYQPKLPEDAVILPKDEYRYLKDMADRYDPFWFCAFGGCEGACKECKDTCEMSIFVKERKKFYDKFNENICTFKLENKSEEYKDGYIQAIADICGRLDKTAVELGVNIKE